MNKCVFGVLLNYGENAWEIKANIWSFCENAVGVSVSVLVRLWWFTENPNRRHVYGVGSTAPYIILL